MKILITGGAGYIGGTVTRLLLQAGHSVTVYDNLRNKTAAVVAEGATLVQGDIADAGLLEKVMTATRFDGVMHFAALIEAGESMQRPEIYFRNNTASTLTLLETMLKTGHDRLVFSSTAACYGEPESTPIFEDAPLRPTNAYGESKLLVEQMLRWFNQIHGFRYASLRYFNVAGAIEGYGENHEPESHLIPLVLDTALGRRESIRIYGQDYPTPDGTCIRDYIHVSDLADAHLLALKALDQNSKLIYNIGNGRGFTVREVIDSVARVTGKAIQVEECPRRPGDPAVLVASSEKIMRELGWAPRFAQLDDIIASAWTWHQSLHRE
ncbi:MAG TPA: UDP-glucose 4-epimerase GalE [Granulicella sp.]|jgi:UDP-glucose 4-epimerase|nr:UDP-glucose 4-epimerase GalE [Granulicella sp.]